VFGARLRSHQVLGAGLVGALLVWVAELIVGPGALRHYVADVGWTGFGLAATISTARAVLAPAPRERGAWACVFLGTLAWTIGQLFWDLYDVVGISGQPPVPSDIGFLVAAALFVGGCAGFLAGHEHRLAVYALVLDVSAAVLTMVAAVALYVSDLFAPAMMNQPATLSVGLAYPVLYVAATGAALSMFWGLPSYRTRRAHLFVLIGVALNTVGFVLWLPDYVHESFAPGTILDPLWMIGILCIGVAARLRAEEPTGESTRVVPSEAVQLSRMLLPGVVALAAAAILVGSQIDHRTATDAIVAATIALTIIVLSVRAGLALYSNWRLGIRERRRAAQFAALYDVGLATAGEISLDELARLAVDNVIRLTQVEGAMIALADPDGSLVIRAINRSQMPQLRDDPGGPLVGVALESVRTREITVVADYAAHPDSNPRLHGTVAAALALPLIAGGELVGTITLYSARQRHWGSETQRMFRLYAAQAAIAISNARLLGESRRLASHDPLTGLTNRRVLVERLEAEVAEARRHGDAFCVILCDVDGLKAVNDTAGHLVGDSVLRSIATTLRATARTEDVVARFGGDEFVLLLPRTALDAARSLATRLASDLPDQTYMWGGVPHALPRVSFGIAAFPDDGLLADQLIAKADERMYADKARARGRLG